MEMQGHGNSCPSAASLFFALRNQEGENEQRAEGSIAEQQKEKRDQDTSGGFVLPEKLRNRAEPVTYVGGLPGHNLCPKYENWFLLML